MNPVADEVQIGDLIERLSRIIAAMQYAEGLPPAQWHALRYLARANRFSRAPSVVGLYLGATKGTVSQTLAALASKGLIERSEDPADGRRQTLALTTNGRDLLARDPLTELDAALACLGPEEHKSLAAALGTLVTSMLARRGGRAFGACRTCRHFLHAVADVRDGGPHRCALLDVALSEADAVCICVEQEAAIA